MKDGKYRRLTDVLHDLEDEGVDPEDILIDEGAILAANPIFKKNPDDEEE